MEMIATTYPLSRTPFGDGLAPPSGGFLGRPGSIAPAYRPPAPAPRRIVITTMGQELPTTPEFSDDMSDEEMIRLAAKLMIDSGVDLASKTRRTYDTYKNDLTIFNPITENWWSLLAGMLPMAIAAWWQDDVVNEGLLRLASIRRVGQKWMDDMTEEWLPQFLDKIQKVDPQLALQVDGVYDALLAENTKVANLFVNIRELPSQVLSQGIQTFWGSVKSDLDATAEILRLILARLGDAAKAVFEMPWWVAAGALVGVVYLIQKS